MSGLSAGHRLAERFELRQLLGTGGSGEVWLAVDQHSGRTVALKILHQDESSDPRQRTLLRTDFERCAGLLHPNIVRMYELYDEAEPVFISMQYVRGETLRSRRGAGFREILRWATMVCDALDYAHRRGVVHRDVKPSNVLLDERGICYLTDFGLAAALTAADRHAPAGGSLPGMSPQQLAGEPATVADDVYGFGALLFELLAGHPLFHPGVTPERICTERPSVPDIDGSGERLPEPLVRLVSAMLEKDPARRPAGMAAVRPVIEELQADSPVVVSNEGPESVIRPIGRGHATRDRATAPPVSSHTAAPGRAGIPARFMFAGLGVLLIAALVVVFVLPDMVNRNASESVSGPEPPHSVMPKPDALAEQAERARADEVLGELLPVQDRLRDKRVELWAADDWTQAAALSDEADEHYRQRDYRAATTGYRRSLTLLKVLEARLPEVLSGALEEGVQALLAGDQQRAQQQFGLALDIDPGNEQARAGLQRADRLDEVLAQVAIATAAESAGNPAAAETAWAAALEVDPQWPAAIEGLRRVRMQLARTAYETQMARGLAALAEHRFQDAQRAFAAALKTRPGDADATAALQQVESERKLQQIVGLQSAAQELEAAEDWAGAVKKYEAALQIDPGLESAQQGLRRASSRAGLARRLQEAIGAAEVLNDRKLWKRARALADEARAVEPKGPVLARQIAALERVLMVASTPVEVQFRSDNLTDVVIYKVGRLGAFDERRIKLRPGRYTAVGSRDGYHDTRRTFVVAADGSTPPIVIRCEEPI